MDNVLDEMANDKCLLKKKARWKRIVVKVWFLECPLFGGKNMLQTRFGAKNSVRCSEFRGVRFSEVANVLQVWDF